MLWKREENNNVRGAHTLGHNLLFLIFHRFNIMVSFIEQVSYHGLHP